MGGRGTSSNNATETGSINSEISSFLDELQDRNYGSSNKMVPKAQQDEFRRVKRDVMNFLRDSDQIITPASGFRYGSSDPENYMHTAAKLNSYQRLLRSDVRSIQMDLDLGVITESQARLELKALRTLDRTIQERRSML